MCKKNLSESEQDMLLFNKVKENMLKVCNEHSDTAEWQLFKNKLEQASSFEDFTK